MNKVIAFYIVMLITLLPTAVEAQEQPYRLELEYPDNQTKAIKGYYHLRVEPDQKQTLHVRLINDTNEEQVIKIDTADAYTQPTGGMLYEKDLEFEDTRLLDEAIRLSEFLKAPESVTLGPNETKTVPIEVTAPPIEKGTVLGGFRVSAKGNQEEIAQANEGEAKFVLITESVTATAVQLNYSEKLPPNLSIGEAGFAADTGNAYITFTNRVQMIQEPISGTYTIKEKNGKALFEGDFQPFKMAPNSEIRFPIPWKYETLEAGDYEIEVNLTANNESIKETRSFSIKNANINEYVERNTEQQPTVGQQIPSWVWIILSITVILIGFLVYLLLRSRKKAAT